MNTPRALLPLRTRGPHHPLLALQDVSSQFHDRCRPLSARRGDERSMRDSPLSHTVSIIPSPCRSISFVSTLLLLSMVSPEQGAGAN